MSKNDFNQATLTEIINVCWDAVNASKVGPVLELKEGNPVLNNIPLNTFYTVLQNMVPKTIQSLNIEPKEPWQNDS